MKKAIDRTAALLLLNKSRTDEIVVSVYQAATTWSNLSKSKLDYTFTGAMGQASSHALGLAVGRPDKKIIVLDGDGSLLMNLGSLVTIGNIKPNNLIHCVCVNEIYETNGSIPIPGYKEGLFSNIAKTAGYEKCYSINDLNEWGKLIPIILKNKKLTFIELHLKPGKKKFKDNFKQLYSTEKRNVFIESLKRN